MIKHNQDGAVNSLVISLVLAIILLVSAAVFGGWAFSSRQDYKNNVDGKIKVAVAAAQVQSAITEKAQLAQDEKQPYYTYQGPPGLVVLASNTREHGVRTSTSVVPAVQPCLTVILCHQFYLQ